MTPHTLVSPSSAYASAVLVSPAHVERRLDHHRCGAYVRAVMSASKFDEVPGERIAVMKVALGADEVPKAKPHPDGLLQCCTALGVQPTAAVYVGDSPSDGKAASAAGMRSIGVLWGANGREALEGNFDVIAEDTQELSKALQGMLLPPKE